MPHLMQQAASKIQGFFNLFEFFCMSRDLIAYMVGNSTSITYFAFGVLVMDLIFYKLKKVSFQQVLHIL